MGCRGKPGHAYADFGDDRRGGHLPNAGDLLQQSPLRGERDQRGLDLAIEVFNRRLQEADVVQDGADEQPVMRLDTSFQGLLQRVQFAA